MAASLAMTRSSLSAPLCALLTLALVPGCSLVKTQGPRSGWRPDRAPECTTDRRPVTADIFVASVFGVGSGLAAATALRVIPSSYSARDTATAMLPGLLIPAAIVGASAIVGHQRTTQCVSAETRWAEVMKASAETNALAEAARKAAHEKAEAARKEAQEKAAVVAQTARKEGETRRTAEDKDATEAKVVAESQYLNSEQAPTSVPTPNDLLGGTPASISVPTNYRSTEGYQQARWGMTVDEVRTLYPHAEAVDNPTAKLALASKTANYNTATGFVFSNNGLTMVFIGLYDHPSGADERMSAFTDLRRLLTQKYGPPMRDGVVWLNKTMRTDNIDDLSTSILFGFAKQEVEWRTQESLVMLDASKGRATIDVTITYASLRLFGSLTKENDAHKLNDL